MRISMDVICMRHIVSELRQMADASNYFIQQIEAHLLALEESWKGPAPSQYLQEQRNTLQKARRQIASCLDLTDQIERDIQEYIRISSSLE